MARQRDLDLMVGMTGTEDLEGQRLRLDERLQRIDRQQACIDQWLEQLEARKDALQRRWDALIAERDGVEQAIWERIRAAEERPCAPAVHGAYGGPVDPAEPWELEVPPRRLTPLHAFGVSGGPTPSTIEPVRRPPRPAPRAGAPSWASASPTAPIVLRALPLRAPER